MSPKNSIRIGLLAFTLLMGFSLVQNATSAPPIVVAVLDSPLDYAHPAFKGVIDEELLKSIKLKFDANDEVSWFELNQEVRAAFEERFDQGHYKNILEFLNAKNQVMAMNYPKAESAKIIKALFRGTIRYYTSKKFRSEVNMVSDYLHGTHVAGIVVKSLTEVKLINFPSLYPRSEENLTEEDILERLGFAFRYKIRSHYEKIAKVFKDNQVRVVNLSIGDSWTMATQNLNARTNILQKLKFKKDIEQRALEDALIYKEEFERFIQSNPDIIFVAAAGNEGKSLEGQGIHSAGFTAENLVVVGSVESDLSLSTYSNFSSKLVNIAAFGTGILSAAVGGEQIHLSGTSMATPMVTNRLAKILEANPSLSAQEAISELYKSHTDNLQSLLGKIQNARVLKTDEPCLALVPKQSPGTSR